MDSGTGSVDGGGEGGVGGGEYLYLYLILVSSHVYSIRGEVRIHWLKPPYAAASCSQFI